MSARKNWLKLAGLLGLVVWQSNLQDADAEQSLVVAGKVRLNEVHADRRIHEALEKECRIEAIEIALFDLMREIEDQFQINIELDTRALDAVGIGADTPVTRDCSGISLRSALQLVLRDLELTWLVQNGTLLITTPEEAEASLILEVYEVSDLLVPRNRQTPTARRGEENGFDSLVRVVTSTIHADSWDAVGGPGTVEALGYAHRNVLVVSQTRKVHDQIEDLLQRLRKIQPMVKSEMPEEGAEAASQPREEEFSVQLYPVGAKFADDLATVVRLVQLSLGREAFNEQGSFVVVLSRMVAVRHNPAVQSKVKRLLTDLGVYHEDRKPDSITSTGGLFSIDRGTNRPARQDGDSLPE